MTQYVMRQFFTASKMYLCQPQPKAASSGSLSKLTCPEGCRPLPERQPSTL